jgi:hypothetical protein
MSSTQRFKYDANNYLVELNQNDFDFLKFENDSKGNPTKITLSNSVAGDILEYNFIYNNKGKIIRRRGTPILPNLLVDDRSYAYDEQGRLIADSQYYNQTPTVFTYKNYSYDVKDNIIELNQYFKSQTSNLFVLDGTIKMAYDNKVNPFFKIGTSLYMGRENEQVLSRNNLVSLKVTYSSTPGSGYFINSIHYEYFNNHLPARAIQGAVNDTNTVRLVYNYK